MAFFKFRKGGGDESQSPRPQPESIEAMRTRARHRLIGAGVLVLLGVVGFPLLFDTQPRPIAVDIPIEIPDRNKARPLPLPPQPAQAPVASGIVSGGAVTAAASTPAASAVAPAKPALAEASRPAAAESTKVAKVGASKPEPKPESKGESKPETRTETKPEPKPAAPKPDDGARAQALLEGKAVQAAAATPTPAAAAEGRYVVQVGAFADAGKAKEARAKVEKAGMKTYTQVAETKDGKRIRVRVGPFATRAEADKAAEKIKGLELPAAILTL